SASSGVASFAGCKIVGTAGSFTLKANGGVRPQPTSTSVTITTRSSTQLVFTTQPGGGANDAVWSQQPVVTVEDSGGNTVTGSSASVTLATNTGSRSLHDALPIFSASSGVASFAGCKIVGIAGSFTLKANG